MSTKLKIKELQKQLKIYRIRLFIVSATCLFLSYLLFDIVYFKQNYSNNNVSVVFNEENNFTDEERGIIYQLIENIKPEYLESAVSINIKRDTGKNYIGKNRWGKIVMEFDEREEIMQIVLCHELLHNLNILNKNATEKIVQDLAVSGVCYKK